MLTDIRLKTEIVKNSNKFHKILSLMPTTQNGPTRFQNLAANDVESDN